MDPELTDGPDAAATEERAGSPQDPLWECLGAIARHHGRAINRDSAVAGLPLNKGKLIPSLVPRAARRANLDVRVLYGDWRQIAAEMLPCIVLLKQNRCCVLYAAEGQEVTVLDPLTSPDIKQISAAELDASFGGRCLLVRPQYSFDERAPEIGKVIRRHWFWGAIAENAKLYRDVLVAAFMINVFAVAMPLFVMNVYDRVVPNQATDTLWMLTLGVGIVFCGDLALRSLRAYFIDLASNRVDLRLSALIMERVLGLRMSERPLAAGSFAANLRSFEMVRDFITSATVTAIIDLPFALIFIGVIAWIGPPLIVPLVFGAVLILLYALSVQSRLQELTELTHRAGAQRNATLVESLVGLEALKAMGAEGIMQRKWEEAVAYLARIGIQLRSLAASTVHGAHWIQQLSIVMVVVIGVYLVGQKELSLGGIIAAMLLSSRGMAPISQVAGLLTQYHHATTALEALDEVMQKPIERPEGSNFVSRPSLSGDIQFRDVSFRYPGQDVDALSEVSFKIRSGEHVALLGRIGSGKSTIHKLILGLYPPDSGAVHVDGIDLRQMDPADLRRQIGYVPQDVKLFFGSLWDNLTMGHEYATDEEVLKAVELAGIKEFVDTHPRGFDMVVGERGESLSGGQRQGVAIARACVEDPPILLLDEPTGSMDHSGEESVKKAMAGFARDKTMVIITHRTALLDLVERIIVIDGGRVVADGPKDQVVEALRHGRIGKVT